MSNSFRIALLLGSGSLEFLSGVESSMTFVAAETPKKGPKASSGKASGRPGKGTTRTKTNAKQKTIKKSPDGDERTSEREAKETNTKNTKGKDTQGFLTNESKSDKKSTTDGVSDKKDKKNSPTEKKDKKEQPHKVKQFLQDHKSELTAAAAVSAAVFLPLGVWGLSGRKSPKNNPTQPRSNPTPTPPNNRNPKNGVPRRNDVPKNVVPPKPAPGPKRQTTEPGSVKENENPQKDPQNKRDGTEEEREKRLKEEQRKRDELKREEDEEERLRDERLEEMTETQVEKAREEKERRRKTRSQPIRPSQPIIPYIARADVGQQQNFFKWGKECVKSACNRSTSWAMDKYNSSTSWATDKYNRSTSRAKESVKSAASWATDKYNSSTSWAADKYSQRVEKCDKIVGEQLCGTLISALHLNPLKPTSKDTPAKKAVLQMLGEEKRSLPPITWSGLEDHVAALKKLQRKYYQDKARTYNSPRSKVKFYYNGELQNESLTPADMQEVSQQLNSEVDRLDDIMQDRKTWKYLRYPRAVRRWRNYYNLQSQILQQREKRKRQDRAE